MKHLRLGRRGFLGAASAAAALASLARGANAEGSTLRIRSLVDIQTLDTAFTFSVHEANINRAQLHNLLTWKKHNSWEWELDAATMVEQVDATHIKFALRDDLGWTNGFGP